MLFALFLEARKYGRAGPSFEYTQRHAPESSLSCPYRDISWRELVMSGSLACLHRMTPIRL